MRQLWLAVLISAMVAFLGSLFISVWSAQTYLAEQLERKNIDIANSLALSLTQLEKEQEIVDLQVASLFNTGHYQLVSVSDSLGRVISKRFQDSVDTNVPLWFIRLFEIQSKPGVAEISTSRDKYGSVQVVSHNHFAYRALWRQAGNLLFWFSLVGVVVGLLAMLVLREIGQALDMVVNQAGAIGERRLMTIVEPKIKELKALARAMNGMVERIWKLFSEEASRIDELRRRVNYDQLTGLPTREYFMVHFKMQFVATETPHSGVLAIIRLSDLNNINSIIGRFEADKLISEIAQSAMKYVKPFEDALSARIKAGEIAILLPAVRDSNEVAHQIKKLLNEQLSEKWISLSDIFQIGVVRYERSDSQVDVLSKVDQALAMAEGLGANSSYALQTEGQHEVMPGEQWHSVISHAVKEGDLTLAFYPVILGDGGILHQEGMVRLRTKNDKPLVLAGEFMPIVSHFHLTPLVDMEVVRLAIAHLSIHTGLVAINISAASIANWTFRSELSKYLRGQADVCSRLCLEVTEYGAFKYFDAFKDICFALKGLGCQVGVEQFGQHMSEIKKVTELGLDYVKLHASLTNGIETNTGNQEFIKRFCEVVRTVGVKVIGVGVQYEAEWAMLKAIGVDAATGSGIGLAKAKV